MSSAGFPWHAGHVSEDVLTGHVFSAFHYVPEALDAFLADLARLNGLPEGALRGKPVTVVPWPAWDVPEKDRNALAVLRKSEPHEADPETTKQSAQPDVVVSGPSWRLVVEAELSKSFEASQLVEHYILSRSAYADASCDTYHVLLNGSLARPPDLDCRIRSLCRQFAQRFPDVPLLRRTDPQIEKRLKKQVGEDAKHAEWKADHVSDAVLWYSWGKVRLLFEGLLRQGGLNDSARRILGDRIALLAHAGIDAIEPPDREIDEAVRSAAAIRTLDKLIASRRDAMSAAAPSSQERQEAASAVAASLNVTQGLLNWVRVLLEQTRSFYNQEVDSHKDFPLAHAEFLYPEDIGSLPRVPEWLALVAGPKGTHWGQGRAAGGNAGNRAEPLPCFAFLLVGIKGGDQTTGWKLEALSGIIGDVRRRKTHHTGPRAIAREILNQMNEARDRPQIAPKGGLEGAAVKGFDRMAFLNLLNSKALTFYAQETAKTLAIRLKKEVERK